jgi:hypothetical protein
VTIPREQLIADWRERLAAASDVQEELPSRAAWLARVRSRLYRFLLSLYGKGDWNAPGAESTTPDDAGKSVVFDKSDLLPFAGKPAKDESTIRKVLSSLSLAKEQPAEQGPLAAGAGQDRWVVVATASWGIEPQSCANALMAGGFQPLLVGHGDDVTVSVRAQHERAAVNLISARINQLRRFKSRTVPTQPGTSEAAITRIPQGWTFTVVTIFHLALTYPLAWIAVALLELLQTPNVDRIPFSGYSFHEHVLSVWRGLLVIVILLAISRANRQKRMNRPRKHPLL